MTTIPVGRKKVPPLRAFAATDGAVSFRAEPTRAATQACAVVALPLKVNPWLLDSLKNLCRETLDNSHLDVTILAYAFFEAVAEKLSGSTANMMKNRVTGVNCGSQNSEFLVSVVCAPTLATARKCAGIVIQNMKWASLYARYAAWCKIVGVKPSKNAFDAAATSAHKATSRVRVVFAGKVNVNADSANKTAGMLNSRIKSAPPSSAGEKRVVSVRSSVKQRYRAFAAPGFAGLAALNFLEAYLHGVPVYLAGGVLYVPVEVAEGVKKMGGDAKKVAKFVRALYGLNEETAASLVFAAAKDCLLPTKDLRISKKASESAFVKSVLAVFV